MLLLGAMAAGVLCGWLFPGFSNHLEILGTRFLRLIRTIVAPLLFGVLVPSMARAGSLRVLGRLGVKAVVYFEIMTTLALGWGLAWTLLLHPGAGFSLHGAAAPAEAPSLRKIIEDAFPNSIFDAMARGDVLQMVIFFLLLGMAANALGAKAEPLVAFAEGLASVIFRYTQLIMWAAPLAVFGSMASTIAGQGSQALEPLAKLIVTAWGAQLSYTVLALGGVASAGAFSLTALPPRGERAVRPRLHHHVQARPHCPRPSKASNAWVPHPLSAASSPPSA